MISFLRIIYFCKENCQGLSETAPVKFFFIYIYVYLGFVFDSLSNLMDIVITIERIYTLKQAKDSKIYRILTSNLSLMLSNIFIFLYFAPIGFNVEVKSHSASSNMSTSLDRIVDERYELTQMGYLLILVLFGFKLLFFTTNTLISGIVLYRLSKDKIRFRIEFHQNRFAKRNHYSKKASDEPPPDLTLHTIVNIKEKRISLENEEMLILRSARQTAFLQKIQIVEARISFMILFMVAFCVMKNALQTLGILTPFLTFYGGELVQIVDSVVASACNLLRLMDVLLYYLLSSHFRKLFNNKFCCKKSETDLIVVYL